MSRDPAVIAARAACLVARARLDTSIAVAKQRLSPRSLANEAVESAKNSVVDAAETGLQAARDRPATTAAVIGAIGLALAHKPLIGWIGAVLRRDDATGSDNAS